MTAVVLGDDGHCIWYKTCYENEMGNKLNCADNSTGYALNQNDTVSKEIMLNRCPDVYKDRKSKPFEESLF